MKIEQGEMEGPAPLTHREIADLVGEIEDAKAVAIIATRCTFKDLEDAVAWAAGESDVMGEAEQPLAGAAAKICEILTAEREPPERRSS